MRILALRAGYYTIEFFNFLETNFLALCESRENQKLR